jgi:hypothetical protein
MQDMRKSGEIMSLSEISRTLRLKLGDTLAPQATMSRCLGLAASFAFGSSGAGARGAWTDGVW